MITDENAYHAGAKAYREGWWIRDMPNYSLIACTSDWMAGWLDAFAEDFRKRGGVTEGR